jgi:hypothetical protein
MHSAVARLNLANSLVEFAKAKSTHGLSTCGPILVTANCTVISGFRDWQAALSDPTATVDCIEYSLSDEEALQFILIHHRPRRFWNSFIRIRLALELEPYFRAKAVANQSHGGRVKGWANLPKAECLEARREVAGLAGVGARNVSHVKMILGKAHPRLIDALQDGTLSIHRAVQLCNLSRNQQMEQFICGKVERATSKVTRQAIVLPRVEGPGKDASAVLKLLQEHEIREPGSIVVRPGDRRETVILLGRDLADLSGEAEPNLT